MEVLLISRDERLCKLCSDVLNGSKQHQWSFSTALSFPADSHFDLYIWDCDPQSCTPISAEQRSGGKHLFLVNRAELGWLRTVTRLAEEPILLKPVTRATLSTFLLQALADHERQGAAVQQKSRADKDELFQSLIEANLRLQEYDQDRTNFLARAVHDFRAPLTAISGYCGLFLDGSLGELDEQQREVVRRMQHSANRLFRLSSAMFELSVNLRVERRESLIQGDIRECAANAVNILEPVLQEKNIHVEVKLQSPKVPLLFEPAQIEQVLVNLLENAGRFTPRRGSIQISGYPAFWEKRTSQRRYASGSERRHATSHEPNCYRVDVRDTGPGIPVEHLGHIFEEYAQVAGGEDRSGAGLGLAICRMILSRHEGQIWAESSSQGATFSFVLPLTKVENPTQCEASDRSLEPICTR